MSFWSSQPHLSHWGQQPGSHRASLWDEGTASTPGAHVIEPVGDVFQDNTLYFFSPQFLMGTDACLEEPVMSNAASTMLGWFWGQPGAVRTPTGIQLILHHKLCFQPDPV